MEIDIFARGPVSPLHPARVMLPGSFLEVALHRTNSHDVDEYAAFSLSTQAVGRQWRFRHSAPNVFGITICAIKGRGKRPAAC